MATEVVSGALLKIPFAHFIAVVRFLFSTTFKVNIAGFSYTKDGWSIDRLRAVFYEETVGAPKFP